MLDNKTYIIDFDDSFTYNIASVLSPYLSNVQVVHYQLFFRNITSYIDFHTKKKIRIILGPGPGHPNDYKIYWDEIEKILNQDFIFVMGICLGHQIILSILGYKILPASTVVHGESIEILYKNMAVQVQRYNSYAPKKRGRKTEIIVESEDVLIYQDTNIISFQFHPESIGTDNNITFFSELLGF
jgi:anthranilate/para-aminobenzoate synthase component II